MKCIYTNLEYIDNCIIDIQHVFNQSWTKLFILKFSNLVVIIKFSIEFEAKQWNCLFVGSSNETKNY
jgi:hypothetical protein